MFLITKEIFMSVVADIVEGKESLLNFLRNISHSHLLNWNKDYSLWQVSGHRSHVTHRQQETKQRGCEEQRNGGRDILMQIVDRQQGDWDAEKVKMHIGEL